jgi:hypothetical protein
MTRAAEWRQHAECRKQIVALKRRLAVTERRLLNLRKALARLGPKASR